MNVDPEKEKEQSLEILDIPVPAAVSVTINQPLKKKTVAIIFTGEPRTFDSVQELLLKNLIVPNNADVFIHTEARSYGCLTPAFDHTIFQKKWGSYVKGIRVLDSKCKEEYHEHVAHLLKWKEGITESRFEKCSIKREYLTRSGTLIEYFQVWQAAEMIFRYEKQTGVKYDIFIRSRLDATPLHPINLEKFFSGDTDSARTYIDTMLTKAYIDTMMTAQSNFEDIAIRWLQGFGHVPILPHTQEEVMNGSDACAVQNVQLKERLARCDYWKKWLSMVQQQQLKKEEKEEANRLLECTLKEVNCIFSFRTNVLWFGLRSPCLSTLSMIRSFGDYWDDSFVWGWNSEQQFLYHLKHHDILNVDHHPMLHEKYLTYKAENLSILKTPLHELPKRLAFVVIRPEHYCGFSF